MIGLGSNRLSVCRRGGMSVTQAGKGGMEWLAGGRIPSWATPYSAQATAALRDAFPTQLPTIRDYGFAHPEIVPIVNRDPYTITYFINLGIIRFIKGDGVAYLDFSFLNNKNYSYYKIITKIDASSSTNNQAIIEGGKYRSFYRSSSSINCQLTGEASSSISSLKGIFRTFNSGSAGRIDLLNDDYTLKTQGSGVFNAYNQVYSSTKGLKCDTKCEYLKFFNSDMSQLMYEFIPCKDEILGNGMIDLLTGIFYPNANSSGSFTISESPAS